MREEVFGPARIFLCDCRDLLSHLAGKYDVVVTDPPYGISYNSGWSTDRLWAAGQAITNDMDCSIRDEALAGLSKVPTLVFGSRKKDPPPGTRMILVWDKGNWIGMGALDIPWKPSSEEIYVLGRGWVGKRDCGNVVQHFPLPSQAIMGRTHPNEKPVGLILKLLQKCPSGVVFDPFMGTGAVGLAALRDGRGFIGCEIEEAYFDIACRRLAAEVAQEKMVFMK